MARAFPGSRYPIPPFEGTGRGSKPPSKYAQVLADPGEGLDRLVEVFGFVGGGNLH